MSAPDPSDFGQHRPRRPSAGPDRPLRLLRLLGHGDNEVALLAATCQGLATSNTSPGIGEDQHAGNTNKAAFPGTRRHDRQNRHVGPVTSVNAGELGRLPALVIRVQE